MDSARPRSLSIYRVRRHCAMDPAWIHDGSDVSDFTKPYVFTGILLGSTMGPRWFPSWDNCETMCFHRDPAWIHDGSDLATVHETTRFHPCLDPRWVHDGSLVGTIAKPYVFIRILLGSTMGPTLDRWIRRISHSHGRLHTPGSVGLAVHRVLRQPLSSRTSC